MINNEINEKNLNYNNKYTDFIYSNLKPKFAVMRI